MYSIAIEPIDQPDILALIDKLDRYQSALYPEESNHLVDLNTIPASDLIMQAIRDSRGQAIGCGAVLLNADGSGEIKRVFIDSAHRGQLLGEKLVASLEAAALERGCHTLQLETGIHQQAAIRLYERCGYQACAAFAPYAPDPLSVFMTKLLVADVRLAAL